jgi:hypothetical protein
VTELTSQVVESYEARIAAGDKVGRKERERAEDALELQKVLQLASLTASAVATWFAMTRDLALIPGNALGAPFEAAGIVAASMIGPASQILGQEIPFVSGRSGDAGYEGNGQAAVRKDDAFFKGQDSDYTDNRNEPRGGEDPRANTARTSGGSVTVSVTFSDGRVGKRSIR